MTLFDVFDLVCFGLFSLFAALGIVICSVMLKEGIAEHGPKRYLESLTGLVASVTWFALLGIALTW